MADLTPKQQRFVDEYLVDLNATAAAKRSGYSARTAEWQGPQLLGKPHVAAAVSAAQQARSDRTKIDADWVLRTLAAEKSADLADLYDASGHLRPVTEWPKVWRTGLVVGVETVQERDGADEDGNPRWATVRKVKLSDRLRHIELIGKHVSVQAFRDRVGHEGPNGGPIPVAGISMTPDEFRALALEMAQKV